MSQGVLISLLINVLVGLYFALIYPRSLRRTFRGNPPPLFALLGKTLVPVGWLLMIGSIGYGGYQWMTEGQVG